MSLYYEKSFCAEYQIVVAAVDVVIVWFQSGYTFIIRADDWKIAVRSEIDTYAVWYC